MRDRCYCEIDLSSSEVQRCMKLIARGEFPKIGTHGLNTL